MTSARRRGMRFARPASVKPFWCWDSIIGGMCGAFGVGTPPTWQYAEYQRADQLSNSWSDRHALHRDRL